ncbi:unnamed protein product, partial [Brenthis ino]
MSACRVPGSEAPTRPGIFDANFGFTLTDYAEGVRKGSHPKAKTQTRAGCAGVIARLSPAPQGQGTLIAPELASNWR